MEGVLNSTVGRPPRAGAPPPLLLRPQRGGQATGRAGQHALSHPGWSMDVPWGRCGARQSLERAPPPVPRPSGSHGQAPTHTTWGVVPSRLVSARDRWRRQAGGALATTPHERACHRTADGTRRAGRWHEKKFSFFTPSAGGVGAGSQLHLSPRSPAGRLGGSPRSPSPTLPPTATPTTGKYNITRNKNTRRQAATRRHALAGLPRLRIAPLPPTAPHRHAVQTDRQT